MKFIIDTNELEVSKSMLETLLENEYAHPISVKEIHKIDAEELDRLTSEYSLRYHNNHTNLNVELAEGIVLKDGISEGFKADYLNAKGL